MASVGRRLREDAKDDQVLRSPEKVVRVIAFLPMALTPLLWTSIRPHLAIPTATSVGVLSLWFLLGIGVFALVVVRTRQRARARRRAAHATARPGPDHRSAVTRRSSARQEKDR